MKRELHKYASIKINIFVYSYLYRCVNICNYSHLFICVIYIYIVTSVCIQVVCCKFLGSTLFSKSVFNDKISEYWFLWRKTENFLATPHLYVCVWVSEYVYVFVWVYVPVCAYERISLYNVFVCVSIYICECACVFLTKWPYLYVLI